ncbi:MAG: hypothetical protein E2O39_06225 [Planctomycetota bacterium]|nr:MAG: hypothetical protein E2O39_06225 [Planctomycetota bacterium]
MPGTKSDAARAVEERDPSRLLTLAEAALLSGVSKAALGREVAAGAILTESDRRGGSIVQVVRLGELARVYPRVLGGAQPQQPASAPRIVPRPARSAPTVQPVAPPASDAAGASTSPQLAPQLERARAETAREAKRAELAEAKVTGLAAELERTVAKADASGQRVMDLARLVGVEQGKSEAFRLQLQAAEHDRTPSRSRRALRWFGRLGWAAVVALAFFAAAQLLRTEVAAKVDGLATREQVDAAAERIGAQALAEMAAFRAESQAELAGVLSRATQAEELAQTASAETLEELRAARVAFRTETERAAQVALEENAKTRRELSALIDATNAEVRRATLAANEAAQFAGATLGERDAALQLAAERGTALERAQEQADANAGERDRFRADALGIALERDDAVAARQALEARVAAQAARDRLALRMLLGRPGPWGVLRSAIEWSTESASVFR